MKLSEKMLSVVDRCCKFTRYSPISTELSCLCFSEGTISAYNGISGITHLADLDLEPMAVPGESVRELLSSLGEIDLCSESENVVISSGKRFETKFKTPLKSLPSWDFEMPPTDSVEPLPKEFFSGLKQVYFSVSKDETKPEMRGVFCSGGYLYSTDNVRITRFPIKLGEVLDFVVPDNLLEYIIDESLPPLGYYVDKTKVWLIFEGFLVFGQRSLLEFPDCKPIFESSRLESEVKFDPVELGKVLDRFSFFCRSYPFSISVVVTPSGKLIVDSSSPGFEYATEITECKTNVRAEIGFSVNLNFFKEIVSKSNRFYINDRYLYFFSDSGLESLLITLGVIDTKSILSRMKKFTG